MRPKLAAVATTYFKYSRAQHIVDRFLDGYGWNGAHHYPPTDLVSLYVDQVGADDLSRERAGRHPEMKIYPAIADALKLGTSRLAVDGVVLVGEHGKYPRNEKGQTKYPRFEFFQEIVKVSARAAAPCRSSTISTFRGTGNGLERCTTLRANCDSRSWRDRACR